MDKFRFECCAQLHDFQVVKIGAEKNPSRQCDKKSNLRHERKSFEIINFLLSGHVQFKHARIRSMNQSLIFVRQFNTQFSYVNANKTDRFDINWQSHHLKTYVFNSVNSIHECVYKWV